MLEKLDEKQEALMNIISNQYETNVLSGDDSYKKDIIEKSINFLYSLADLKSPEILICPSPIDMAIEAGLKKGESIDYLGNGYDSGWTAFYDYFERIGIEFEEEIGFSQWKDFILNSGVFATVMYENVAFVCIRPCVVKRNQNDDLHCVDGPAIAWRDGYCEYALNGIFVDENIVMTHAEKLNPILVVTEKNAEIRREIVRKIGIERVIQKLGSETIDSQDGYELLLLDLKDGRKREFLKMKNPSIGTYHIEGVLPGTKTVKEALEWRNNGLKGSPILLT